VTAPPERYRRPPVNRRERPSADVRVVAVDVGGTDIKGALVDGDARRLAERSLPTPLDGARTAERVLDAVAGLIEELRDPGVAAVGLAVPGLVDDRRGVAVFSENLYWTEVPFAAEIADRCGLPAVLGHDVRTGALAETRLGAARGLQDVVFLPIGTGIAAGLVLGGRIHVADGYAGEIGHTDAGHDEPCACGRSGCLEAIASAAAIARRYSARSGRRVAGAADVVRAAATGDPDAQVVWDEALDALAAALAWLASVLAPEAVVIGGGLSRAGDALLDPLNARIPRHLSFQRVPRLVPAALGDRAGCMGAGLLALDSIRTGT
jgi:glucokinase